MLYQLSYSRVSAVDALAKTAQVIGVCSYRDMRPYAVVDVGFEPT